MVPARRGSREYLRDIARVTQSVNADLIAGGLSPLKPELATIAAARMVPREIDRPASKRVNFALETKISGRTYVPIAGLEDASYRIQIEFLRLSSVDLALPRIEGRVRQLGHDVGSQHLLRRCDRSAENFLESTNPWRNSGLYMTIQGIAAVIR